MFSYTPLISALRQLKISSDLFSDQVQLTLALKMKHNFSKHLYRQQRKSTSRGKLKIFLLKSKKSSCIPCFLWAMSGMRTSRLITRQLLLSAWNQGGVTLHAPVQLLSAAICQVCSAKLFFLFILCSLLFLIWTPYYFLCDFPKVSKPLKSLWISLLLRAFQFNRSD